MPVQHTKNRAFHYELAGVPGAPVLLFSNSLGTDLSMWHPQAQTLAAGNPTAAAKAVPAAL